MTGTDRYNATVVSVTLETCARDALTRLEAELRSGHPLRRIADMERVRGYAEEFAQTRDARTWFLTTLPPF